MEKNFGCLFYLKKVSKNQTGEIFIYLRITVDSSSTELSTKRKCFKESWNVQAGRVHGKTDYAKSINTYLDTLQQKVFEAKRKLIELDIEITPQGIKDLMFGKSITNNDICLWSYSDIIMNR